MTRADPTAILSPHARTIDDALVALLDAQPTLRMYDMLRYFFGFLDEYGQPTTVYGGKRFRSALLLYLADCYGAREEALDIAVAIELFHNFTLIHDDIEDNDTMRRGRPTVWKLWGVAHAINAGDAQLILAHETLARGCRALGVRGEALHDRLMGHFREVAEGQFLDFTLAEACLDDPRVSEEACATMLLKKTSVLVGCATYAAGVIADRPSAECDALWEFGCSLGMAFQLHDDRLSIWGTTAATGKVARGDIHEKKKTLPIIVARDALPAVDRTRLVSLYATQDPLDQEAVDEVLALLARTDARLQLDARIGAYRKAATEMIESLSITDEHKRELAQVLAALVPETVS